MPHAEDAPAEVVAETKEKLKPLVDKALFLQDRFIARPPLRWLHDLIMNMAKVSGYPEGLFEGEYAFPEDTKTWNKKQKVQFVQRLLDCDTYAHTMLAGAPPPKYKLTPQLILSGKKGILSNEWLQSHCAAAAAVSQLDLKLILRKCNGEDVDLVAPTPAAETPDNSAGDAKAAEEQASKAAAEAKRKAAEADEKQKRAKAAREEKAKADKAAEREARRKQAEERKRKAAEAKAAQESAPAPSSVGGGGGELSLNGLPMLRPTLPPRAIPPATDSEDFVATSKRMINSIISQNLNDKHLRRPPFKFMCEIFFAIEEATGWPKGLFTQEEYDRNNDRKIKVDPRVKAAFFKKVIDAINVCNNIKLAATPRNIVGGKAPEDTNVMLQEFVKGACSGISSADVVARYTLIKDPAALAEAKAAAASGGGAEPRAERKGPSVPMLNMQKAQATQRDEVPAPQPEPEPEPEPEAHPAPTNYAAAVIQQPAPSQDNQGPARLQTNRGGGLNRLKTARRAPPKVKEQHLIEEQKEKSNAPSGLIMEGEAAEADTDSEEENTELDGGIGADGQPQGKLVAHILATAGKNQEKEEKQTGPFNFKRLQSARPGNRSEGLFSKQQIDLLAAQIQAISSSANPLGKCIDYVYEDIEHMQTEHAKWRQDYQRHSTLLEEEKSRVATILEPLETELQKHEVNIAEQKKKIFAMKAQIFRNQQALAKVMDQKSEMVKTGSSTNYY